ncbi:hypothetical protein EAE99_007985 [Botrytis elliptica]|nr:hypothetical protein EAE99_007985 [Botrytis elliptica]
MLHDPRTYSKDYSVKEVKEVKEAIERIHPKYLLHKSQTTPTPTPFLLRPVFCLIPRKFATSEESSNPIWISDS